MPNEIKVGSVVMYKPYVDEGGQHEGGVGMVDAIKLGTIVTLYGHQKLYALNDLELISPSLEELVEERDGLRERNYEIEQQNGQKFTNGQAAALHSIGIKLELHHSNLSGGDVCKFDPVLEEIERLQRAASAQENPDV